MTSGSLLARDAFQCPDGQTFYACDANNFRGCCSTDPCALSECPDAVAEDSSSSSTSSSSSSSTSSAHTPASRPSRGMASFVTKSPEPVTTTMTDSGTTHTIPNGQVITVTEHTLITDGVAPEQPTNPPPLSTPTTSADTIPPALPTDSEAESGSDESSGSLSSKSIVGVAVGSVGAVALLAFLVFFIIRWRKKSAGRRDSAHNSTGRQDVFDEKNFRQSLSPHTTGSQTAGDPFAPFGGRADDPYRPRLGAYEMDATTTAPVELPATSPGAAEHNSGGNHMARENSTGSVIQSPSSDPRATLGSLRREDGQPAYVNHWNQYKSMGSSTG